MVLYKDFTEKTPSFDAIHFTQSSSSPLTFFPSKQQNSLSTSSNSQSLKGLLKQGFQLPPHSPSAVHTSFKPLCSKLKQIKKEKSRSKVLDRNEELLGRCLVGKWEGDTGRLPDLVSFGLWAKNS
ncbi:hypothetical protein CK203_091590 [Vitis vinifera]|uniref:Uncharacterized protein n=1 Tax=Vitis vinifera TaxID=29760 RepID=A0A438D0R7_VITVI|nr:hypothetical protein CK203_091590 [Vitis vinifera]